MSGVTSQLGTSPSTTEEGRQQPFSSSDFRQILEHLHDPVALTDANGIVRYCTSTAERLLGQAPQTLYGHNLFARLHPTEQRQASQLLQQLQAQESDEHGELTCRYQHPQGHWLNLAFIGKRLDLPDADQPLLLFSIRDVSASKEASALTERYYQAIEQTDDLITITDRHGIIEYVNPAFERCTGFSRQQVIGRKPNVVKSDQHDPEFYQQLWDTLARGRPYRNVFLNRRIDGSLFYEEKTITPLRDENGRITHFISTGKDISERLKAQERLSQLAHYDPLTRLPNRTLLLERLQYYIDHARQQGAQLAVIFIGLDRFKTINESLGHLQGDHLLQDVAQRLQQRLGSQHLLARLGGDEFVVLQERIRNPRSAAYTAQKVLNELQLPFTLNGEDTYISASIGITLYPTDANDVNQLLRNADAAMRRAKQAGGECYRFFTDDMTVQAASRLQMENQLRHALLRKEFSLEYQPRMQLDSWEPIGVEALLRWRRQDGSRVSPAEFIPLLEEMGLITSVGEWVLHTACRQAKAWQEAGLPPQRVAVNLSAKQFQQANLCELVAKCLEHAALEPRYLELEITEGLLIENIEDSIHTLQRLHDMGVHISMDDFGTGYSSLAYLKRFPIHTLKIDKSFVDDIGRDADDEAIVLTIISLARHLRLNVTAEGIERKAQLEFIARHGCHEAQGFLLAKPMSAEALTEWLKNPGPADF